MSDGKVSEPFVVFHSTIVMPLFDICKGSLGYSYDDDDDGVSPTDVHIENREELFSSENI